MPTMQKLADNGLTYSQWHTTALCSPTRSTLLTGRNHHLNAMASITECSNGFPGACGRVPAQCAPLGAILQQNGYSTFWLGKEHNVPDEFIANLTAQNCAAHWIKLSASEDGSFTMTNARTGEVKKYAKR